jgi:tyrosyl-DNA phosphodiesterase 2
VLSKIARMHLQVHDWLYRFSTECQHFAIPTAAMDELFQKAMARSLALRKTSPPWDTDKISAQSYFAFGDAQNTWKSQATVAAPSATLDPSVGTRLALYSWNIDFMLPLAGPRMEAALHTLQDVIGQQASTTATVIFLQECLQSDLATIAKQPWVRENFYMTDLDSTNWASDYYGTVTLVDRRLLITSCFRVHYEKTRMERDGLFVDILVGGQQRVRLCNTHLESMAMEPPFRPSQLKVVAEHLHAAGVHGAAVAGDFNAIQDFDRTLHTDNGLKDAYLELGGQEDSEDGYTWGQQAPTALRERFGCSRMDKVFFRGGLQLEQFGRFGAGVQLDGEQGKSLVPLGIDKPWITDHLGILAEFQVTGLMPGSRANM